MLGQFKFKMKVKLTVQAKTEELMTADYAGDGGWGDDNPSVFMISADQGPQGEFQVTNGYGPDKAPLVMKVQYKRNGFQKIL